MTAATINSEATCPQCRQSALRRFQCRACGDPRNQAFALRMGRWWTSLLLVGLAVVALVVIACSLRERDREQRIDARVAQLTAVRVEQRQLREQIATVEANTAKRTKAAKDLERQAPRLRKQLATATREAGEQLARQQQLESALAAGVLPPGVEP